MKIAVIYGSSRPSKTGEHVANWLIKKADFGDNEVDLINLADQNLPMVPEATSPMMVKDRNYETAEIKAWSDKIVGYDAYVIVAAEYNLGYTPILKNAIDVLFHEWSGKPVAYVSYGSYPKSTSVEQLRTIMSPFKTDQVEATAHITPFYEAISPEGEVDESKVTGDVTQVIADLLAKL